MFMADWFAAGAQENGDAEWSTVGRCVVMAIQELERTGKREAEPLDWAGER
jgi:hypothetical protein